MDHAAGWIVGEQDTAIGVLYRAVAAVPDKPFLRFPDRDHTYREVDLASTRLAHALTALGVKAGHTVVTMLDNNVDAVLTWLAANKISAVSVPVNTALRGEFLRHQIADASAAIVICEADYLPRVAAVADRLPEVKLVLHRGALAEAVDCPIPVARLDDHRGTDESPIPVPGNPSALAALIYTAGTTGPSKGCMLSTNYMCNLARQQLRAAPAGPDDVLWTPLPLFHLNALSTGIISTMMVTGTIAFSPRFSVSGFWPDIERTGATVVSILGAMGNLLAGAADDEAMARCFGQVHTVRGNPFSEHMKTTWRERFGAKHVGSNGYGLTEAAVVTSLPGGEYAAPGSSGKRIPDFDVRIFDDNDHEVPPGQSGEIVVRPLKPDIMFQGYWRRPEDTLKIMRNMWLHTGDIGKFDEDGFFYFVDRKKDYLRRRGENISSFEMEAAFLSHPDIEECAVHAVPSPVGEDDVKVTAKLKPGAKITEEELCRWAVTQVPYYAVPRYIEFRDSLPRNPQGRVLKYQLREEGCTPGTWDLDTSGIKLVKR
ncbi:MAG: putative AMP-dependent synthetase and ligase [Phenylobacterium sp.]|nr:putative AMP-dependent synthetase and ligase [Phenylobacterium sp.]